MRDPELMEDIMERTESPEAGQFDPDGLLALPLVKVLGLGRAAERLFEAELEVWEVSVLELRILSVCVARPGITSVEVSRAVLVDPPAVSRRVNTLTQRGLLSRRRSRTDRREVRLRITDSGLALLGECQSLLEQAAERFLRSLGETRARTVTRTVETLLTAVS